MSTTSGYTLEPFDAASPYFNEVVRIYLEAFGGEEDAIRAFIAHYANTLPDWRGYVALIGADVAGMGFGTRSLPGQWWHDRVAAEIGADLPALQDAWVLVDLAVRSAYRNQGIGADLLKTLLASQPCPHALLSTEVANAGARQLYERSGWRYLHPGLVFMPGQQPFVIMGCEISSGA
ncbi:MAG TPA: GNAT family N-acetyltransferase [Ktedonobacterales bacterium]|nr:GNAT family N-acetyltransferase [Ktedonobacterales bacterium]